MRRLRASRVLSLVVLTALAAPPRTAHADGVDGAKLLRLLGPRAQQAFAPAGAPGIGALVRLPPGTRATDVGLLPVAPGLGRLYGRPATLLAFADAHPGLPMEVVPPLHALLNTAGSFVEATTATARGLDGTGALVGVADTGLDVTHADFLDAKGQTRVAWLLDLSAASPEAACAALDVVLAAAADACAGSAQARGVALRLPAIGPTLPSGAIVPVPAIVRASVDPRTSA